MLYEKNQNIFAWYRRKTDGEIESISVNPRADEEDQVCYIVKRTVNGSTVRNVEYVKLGQYRGLQNDDTSEMWFVDDGIRVAGSGMTSVSGLEHLEGENVAILCDARRSQRGLFRVALCLSTTPPILLSLGDHMSIQSSLCS